MALGGEYIMLQGGGIEEQTLVLQDSVFTDEDVLLNSQLASELYDVLCDNRQFVDASHYVSCELSEPMWTAGAVEESPRTKDANLQEPPEVFTDDQRAVTHIEIIKSSGCRRVSGANRVVPLLTNALKAGKPNAGSDVCLAEQYRVFLHDGANGDNNRKCEICGLECLSCTQLEHHLKSYHKMSEVTSELCFVCRKKYIFRSRLRSHLSHIHGIQTPELICKTCFMEFNTTSEQKAHERKHGQMYSCHFCGEKFPSEYLCQKHLKKHLLHSEPTECTDCGKRFKTNNILEIHKRRHLQLNCNICGYVSSDELEKLRHLKIHNSEDIELFLNKTALEDQKERQLEKLLAVYAKQSSKSKSDSDSGESAVLNAAKDCMSSMVNSVSILNKRISDLGSECKICCLTVSSGKELLDHQRQFHLRNRKCSFCGKRNRSVSQTWRHMKTHFLKERKNASDLSLRSTSIGSTILGKFKAQALSCTVCHKKLSSSDNLALPLNGHKRGDRRCAECELIFSQPKLLMKCPSSQETKIKCQSCSKSFQSQKILEEHLKRHIFVKEKKIYKCTLCPVSFSTLSELIVHQRCHTGERPYTCGQCQRKFKRLQGVKKHIQVVHNKASLVYHSCPKCSKRFNSLGNLMRHYLRVHCQLRRYICGICGCRFSQNQDLQKHFKTTHKLEMPNIPYTDRKALKEIYVIPGVDDLPDTNPHALKIKQIVAEEKAKFNGVAELLKKKSDRQKGIRVEVQHEEESQTPPEEEVDLSGLPPLRIRPEGQNKVFYIATSGPKGDPNEINKNVISGTTYPSKINLPSVHNSCEVNLYSCQHCSKVFVGESLLLEHFQERNKFTCEECRNVSFCSETLLEEHITSHHALFRCHVCNELFVGKELLVNHLLNVEGIAILEDVQEGAQLEKQVSTFISGDEANALVTPMEESSNVTILPNEISDISDDNENCMVGGANMLYNYPSVLSNHFSSPLNINGILLPNVILQPNSAIMQSLPLAVPNGGLLSSIDSTSHINIDTTCDTPVPQNSAPYPQTSDFVTDNESKLQVSLNGNMSNVRTEQYNIEDGTILTSEEMGANVNEQVMEIGAEDVGGENLKEEVADASEISVNSKNVCKVCGEKCANAAALSRHQKSHLAVSKPFGCAQCGKHFSEKHNLKMHMMIHTGERPYKCEECGKQLRYRKEVVDHKRMHSGEKLFGCDECGRKFMRQRELNRHKVTHTGEKKYKCPVCGKAFGRLDQLNHSHMPTHGPQPLFNCQICEKGFRLKSKLKRHEVLHTGLKKYQCHLCKKSFALEPYLKTHLQSHKKQDSYLPCSRCSRRFASEATLQVHEKTFHDRTHKSGERVERALKSRKKKLPVDSGLGGDEMQDVDLCSILESDNCDAVIYLQMGQEDLKLTLNGVL